MHQIMRGRISGSEITGNRIPGNRIPNNSGPGDHGGPGGLSGFGSLGGHAGPGGPGGPVPEAPGKALRQTPLVVVCHGFTGSKEGGGRALAMGEALAGLGFSTLLFDFAGCGESEGRWEDITLSGHLEDLAAVTAWSRREGFSRIILNGRSFGGTAAICYAARDPEIAAVCTWAAVARPLALFSGLASGRPLGAKIKKRAASPGGLVALAGEGQTLYIRRRFFGDLERCDIPACASRLAPRPLLLIHGTADAVVPCAEAEMLYRAAGSPRQIALIPGADHRFSAHTGPAWQHFFDWLTGCGGISRP